MRRAIGFLMLLVALIGLAISVAGTVIGFRFVDNIGSGLDQTLELASDSLDTVNDTLLLTKQTVEQGEQGIGTVVETAETLATTIDDTRPLLDQVGQVATGDVPDSLEAVQNTIPNLVEVAGAIDDTLETLSAFQVERSVLGVEFAFDLGIDYEPEQPFDESIAAIGTSLDGVPDSLRALESDLSVANDNLGTMSQNILTISEDLATINESVSELPALIDDYIRLVDEVNDLIRQAKTSIDRQLQNVKIGVIVLFVWFGLNQVVPLYLGLDLLSDGTLGSRKKDEDEEPEEVKPQAVENQKTAQAGDDYVGDQETEVIDDKE